MELFIWQFPPVHPQITLSPSYCRTSAVCLFLDLREDNSHLNGTANKIIILLITLGFFLCPMPPHVLVDFVVLPPEHGSSVTYF